MRASASWPSHCSGAMKAGVPISAPVCVNCVCAACERASPKSATLTIPPLVRNRLLGFTSRWTRPISWAAASPAAASRIARVASRQGIGRPGPIALSSEPPSTYSMAMNTMPLSTPTS